MNFLTATWQNLAFFNFRVPVDILQNYLPKSCEVDTSLDGHAYVSLVALDFRNTRVLGIPFPGFVNFPEINLRIYVRHSSTGDRGVVFISELVPQPLIAWMARLTYNESYQAVRMHSSVKLGDDSIAVQHHIVLKGHTYQLQVAGALPSQPTHDPVQTFFKDHCWGFSRTHGGQPIRYYVEHAPWDIYPVKEYTLNWSFSHIYGPQWGFLDDQAPHSVHLAAGSPVNVKTWRK